MTISKTLTQQGAEILYGLGALDARLREDMKSHFKNERVIDRDKNEFRHRKTGEPCSVQEALFYYFGLLINVIAEPADWYAYGRYPVIVEVSDDELAMMSWLYWFGFPPKPSVVRHLVVPVFMCSERNSGAFIKSGLTRVPP